MGRGKCSVCRNLEDRDESKAEGSCGSWARGGGGGGPGHRQLVGTPWLMGRIVGLYHFSRWNFLKIYFFLKNIFVFKKFTLFNISLFLSVLDLFCYVRASLVAGSGGFSLVVTHGLSCPVARSIFLDHGRIEPVSPASAGRSSTAGPPGKSS